MEWGKKGETKEETIQPEQLSPLLGASLISTATTGVEDSVISKPLL